MKSETRTRAKDEDRWAEWMAEAQRGDRASYDRLLRSVLPHLRAFVRMRIRDPSTAEDVVQNVLLSIHQARHTYRPERPFRPWLRAIARNAVIDSFRAQGIRGRVEVPFIDLEPLRSESPEVDGGEALSPVLIRALSELPRNQREAIELLHVEELSSAEAARRVGISPVALRVRAHRGYKTLRLRLRREDL